MYFDDNKKLTIPTAFHKTYSPPNTYIKDHSFKIYKSKKYTVRSSNTYSIFNIKL